MVFRVLQNLLILDGERLSYRTLDVEQIGSVYETMMGFNLEVAQGRSIAIKPTKPHGAPTTINLEELLAAKPADRAQVAQGAVRPGGDRPGRDRAEGRQDARGRRRGPGEEGRPRGHAEHRPARGDGPPAVRRAPASRARTTRRVADRADRRARRSGRSWSASGPNPTPEQILDLKVCDPAMGSGAFLVEACRCLAELLVKAWHAHDCVPSIPPDEDEILHARRIVAQRCLYGVDKNPMAVDLAKLSLWLATLAKDHPFTFLDHALRCGDSLVGLIDGSDRWASTGSRRGSATSLGT